MFIKKQQQQLKNLYPRNSYWARAQREAFQMHAMKLTTVINYNNNNTIIMMYRNDIAV